jgi:nicotinamidase/pyrazinamidase
VSSALILIDIQNDFLPKGALAVPNGDHILPFVKRQMESFPFVVASQDWHPENHCSFQEQGGLWPKHCVAHTHGAELSSELDKDKVTHFVKKGMHKESYSAFSTDTGLVEFLKKRGVEHLYLVGLALDVCVKASALDAINAGFKVTVLLKGCAALSEEGAQKTIEILKKAHVFVE